MPRVLLLLLRGRWAARGSLRCCGQNAITLTIVAHISGVALAKREVTTCKTHSRRNVWVFRNWSSVRHMGESKDNKGTTRRVLRLSTWPCVGTWEPRARTHAQTRKHAAVLPLPTSLCQRAQLPAAMAADGSALEELYVLRVRDHALADRLHRLLRDEHSPPGNLELAFTGGVVWVQQCDQHRASTESSEPGHVLLLPAVIRAAAVPLTTWVRPRRERALRRAARGRRRLPSRGCQPAHRGGGIQDV